MTPTTQRFNLPDHKAANASSTSRRGIKLGRNSSKAKLMAYSIATGAGALLASDVSAATISYSPPGAPVVLNGASVFGQSFAVDLDANGVSDFNLVAATTSYGPGLGFLYGFSPTSLIMPMDPFSTFAAWLDTSATVGPDSSDWWGSLGLNLFEGNRGYAGVEFLADDGLHFGFLDVEVDTTAQTVTLYGGGYESQPDVAATPVPESGCLGLLALGASGLAAWRGARRRDTVSVA